MTGSRRPGAGLMMVRRGRPAGAGLTVSGKRWLAALAAAVLAVGGSGCGSVASPSPVRRPAPPPRPVSLSTSVTTASGTWAVALMGGSAARFNNFWQIIVRPAGSAAWRLATPPGVASNGGLVLAAGARQLLAGFRPSQDLIFSPLASTADDGSTWSPGVLDAALADTPDALAASPAASGAGARSGAASNGGGSAGGYLALLANGTIDRAGPAAATWSRLTSLRSLAAAPAGRRCAPSGLTAVAVTPAGTPLAAASCTRPGLAGIFTYTPGSGSSKGTAASTGTWRTAGPTLPAALAAHPVQVLRLTSTAAGGTALLATGSGRSAQLLAAWSRDGARWAVSSPLPLAGGVVQAAGFAATGAAWVLLADGHAETITGPGAAWRTLPRPPAHTSLLAFGPAASVQALATFGSKLTIWNLAAGSAGWRQAQVVHVPVQYGSSS